MKRPAFAAVVIVLAGLGALFLIRTSARVDAYRTLEMALATDVLTNYTGQVRVEDGSASPTRYTIIHEQPNRDSIYYTSPRKYTLLIVRRSDRAVCMDPKSGEVFSVPGGGTRSLKLAPRLIRENYNVRIVGTETMAGRKAIHLSVTPKYTRLSRRELWVDAEKYLVLCSRDLDVNGRMLYEERFTEVQYWAPKRTAITARFNEEVAKAVPLASRVDPKAVSEDLGFNVSAPSRIPRGYVMLGTYLSECPCGCGGKAALFRYTDGLNSLSVFQTIHVPGQCGSGTAATMEVKEGHCAIIRSGRDTMAVMQKHGVHVIAIGNLPAHILGGVANGVAASKAKAPTPG